MFNKTKRKIVFTVVFSLLALMIVTLATVYLSNRAALDRENRGMLKTFAERFSLENEAQEDALPPDDAEPGSEETNPPPPPPGDRPGRNEPAFRLSTFYAVAVSENGEILAVNTGERDLQSEDSLIGIATSILNKGKKSGKTGGLTYLVEERDGYTLVAMIDGTINDKNQTLLFRQMLLIGTAATAILLLISIFLARRIVRPLEENDEKQKRFVSDAGHELKTPIAVVSANCELLKRQIGENEWLSNVEYENGRMADLVKQLLFLSRAERRDVPKETLDLSELTTGEALPFESLAFERGKKIESQIEPGVFAEGNANQLRQLVSILLDNALSHGTGEVIELSLWRERHAAILTVANDAEEIGAEQLARLFDRFYRADEARTENAPHYGLGLSIAQAIVLAHGGAISAAYKNGKAIFTVQLPAKKSE